MGVWATVKRQYRSYLLLALKKKGSQEKYFDSILFNYWISTIKLVF